MADNILSSGIGQLNELKKELRLFNQKSAVLDEKKQLLNQKQKQLNAKNKEKADEIDKTIKKRREEVSATYDKEIAKEQGNLKDAKDKKNKEKQVQVKDRIKNETAKHQEDNDRLKAEIKAAIAEAGAPSYVARDWYYLLFMPKGIGQYIKLAMLIVLAFLIVPGGICFLLPEELQKVYILVPIYGIIVVLVFLAYSSIEKSTLVPYNSLLLSIRDAKETIRKNKKKIKKITDKINRDKNEDLYELDTFQKEIREREVALEKVSDRKQDALNDFDKNKKQELEKDINAKYNSEINKLTEEIEELNAVVADLSEEVKEQSLYLSENYETYIGKEFMKEEKINELIDIIKSGQASNVSLAIQVSRVRR